MMQLNKIIEPHVYQNPVIKAATEALQYSNEILFVMATGLGKTITSAFIVKEQLLSGKKGIFLCHENDILAQAQQEYIKIVGNTISYKTFYGLDKDWSVHTANMVFASFQSMNHWSKKWYLGFDPTHFDFMVVDEGHHGKAPSYEEVINYFDCKKISMTATPERMDGKNIRELFGDEVAVVSLEEAIVKGWLASVEYHILSDGINNSKLREICKNVLHEGKRLSVKQINETIFIRERDLSEKLIIEEYSQIRKYTKGKKAMIFCESIAHAENLLKYFKQAGIVHSKRTDKENKKTLKNFREGKLRYILSIDKFNEGVDVPDVGVVVFLRSTDSMTIFFQQLGRGLRRTPRKKKVIVLDFVANCERLIMVRDLMNRVREETAKLSKQFELDTEVFHVSGKGFDFSFSDELVDVLKVIEALKKGFYRTWREASTAALGLKIKSKTQYRAEYKKDLRLHSTPISIYPDFPGWDRFLGKLKKDLYTTWEEASAATRKLGITTYDKYKEEYDKDPKLPSHPDEVYKNWAGYKAFFKGVRPYGSWKTAAIATGRIGIKSMYGYKHGYKNDPKLPPNPAKEYSDFPGYQQFFTIAKETILRILYGKDRKYRFGVEFGEKYRKHDWKRSK